MVPFAGEYYELSAVLLRPFEVLQATLGGPKCFPGICSTTYERMTLKLLARWVLNLEPAVCSFELHLTFQRLGDVSFDLKELALVCFQGAPTVQRLKYI